MKEAYYFSHDSNARNDDKIIKLRMKYKWEGFGLYWAIIERLREATDYMCIKDYNVIAFDLRVDASVIKSIIEDFGLFIFTDCGKYFYSKRLKYSMDLKSQKASENAKKRWNKSENDTTAMQPHSNRNAIKVKESKEKEIKEVEDEGERQQAADKHPPQLIEDFKKFNEWVKEKAHRVTQLKNQISIDEFKKLKEQYPDMKTPAKILIAMHNYKPLTSKYVDVYLTLKKWISKDGN